MATCEHDWVPHATGGFECTKCPAWVSWHVSTVYDDPRADHDDTDDGEVRCAGCKMILTLDRNGVIDHQCSP
jgi:hypothetical protein